MKHLPLFLRKWLAARWYRNVTNQRILCLSCESRMTVGYCFNTKSSGCRKQAAIKETRTRYNLTEQNWNP